MAMKRKHRIAAKTEIRRGRRLGLRIGPRLLPAEVLITVETMQNKLTGIMGALVLGGALLAGTVGGMACDDNNTSGGTAGTSGGRGGTGGTFGNGGGGGTAASMTFNMQLSGAQEVPANGSTATASVTVVLDRTTGAVTVNGTFSGLSSNGTVAHIHGPAAVGQSAAPIVPLMVSPSTSGTVTGSGMMNATNMNDMLGGMTYVNIHSTNFPDGEIRAQIVP
jgi:hypothetical protein